MNGIQGILVILETVEAGGCIGIFTRRHRTASWRHSILTSIPYIHRTQEQKLTRIAKAPGIVTSTSIRLIPR